MMLLGRLLHTGELGPWAFRARMLTYPRLMGSLTNNGRKLANFAGFYKGIQSAGAAIASNIDARSVPFMTQFAINWGLLAGSILIAAPIVVKYVKDTVPIEEDLKFSDETISDVAPDSMLGEVKDGHH